MKPTRFKCICAYDGTDFRGWQSQAGGLTVQDFIEARLEKVLKKPVRIHASGRTDAGVHAKGQAFHFDAEWAHSPEKLLAALRSGPASGIAFVKLVKAPKGFHGRYGVKGKRYVYYICEGFALPHESRYMWSYASHNLDVSKMNEAAQILLGEHDFTAFSGNNRAKDDPVKTVYKLAVTRRGKKIKIETEGSGYMYKMVRLISGALVDVGSGKLGLEDLRRHLEAKERTNLIQPAPAQGLFLEKVFY